MTSPDNLDALLSLGEVNSDEILALVPALVRASEGDIPDVARPLLLRLATAAGVSAQDDEVTAARKVAAFVQRNAPREEVKRGLFTLAAGRALEIVKAGAQAAFERFADDAAQGAVCPSPDLAHSGKRGMSAIELRTGGNAGNGNKTSKGD